MKIALMISNNLRTYFPALLLCLSVGMASNANSAVILQTDSNGNLTGATGVVVDGTSYNVAFREGTCASVFGSCTSSNFAFQSNAAASAASQALLDQVFLNSVLGQFDAVPETIFGCTNNFICETITPYAFRPIGSPEAANPSLLSTIETFDLVFSANRAGSANDVIATQLSLATDFDSATHSTSNFAVWSLSVPPESNVPEPSSIALLGAGVTLLGLRRREPRN